MKTQIDLNHFLLSRTTADIYAELPETGKVTLTNCKVTIAEDDSLEVIPIHRTPRKKNQRIFKASGVTVMTRPDGTYVLTAEIDATEESDCAKTKRLIASGIKKALSHYQKEGGAE